MTIKESSLAIAERTIQTGLDQAESEYRVTLEDSGGQATEKAKRLRDETLAYAIDAALRQLRSER